MYTLLSSLFSTKFYPICESNYVTEGNCYGSFSVATIDEIHFTPEEDALYIGLIAEREDRDKKNRSRLPIKRPVFLSLLSPASYCSKAQWLRNF